LGNELLPIHVKSGAAIEEFKLPGISLMKWVL
jgi:hypothetical protein